jgi:hypothetical protein
MIENNTHTNTCILKSGVVYIAQTELILKMFFFRDRQIYSREKDSDLNDNSGSQ